MQLHQLRLTKPGLIPIGHWNALLDLVGSSFVKSFTGGAYSRTLGGTALWTESSAGGSSASVPFSATVGDNGDGTYTVTVSGGKLLISLRPDDEQTITNLATPIPLLGNDTVWLGIVFDSSGTITDCRITSGGNGDTFDPTAEAWSASDAYIEDDGGSPPAFQTARIMLHQALADGDGKPVLTQKVTSHLILRAVAVDGRPALFAFPTTYAPYATA